MSLEIVLNRASSQSDEPVKKEAFYLHVLSSLTDNPYACLTSLIGSQSQQLEQGMFLSLVHIDTGHNDAMVTAIDDEIQLSSEELSLLGESLCMHLQQEGFTVQPHPCPPLFLTHPKVNFCYGPCIDTLKNDSLIRIIHRGEHRAWLKLMTELQMILTNHPVNLAREGAGKLTANGVWFWGNQAAKMKGTIRTIMSDDPMISAWFNARGYSVIPYHPEILTNHVSHIVLKEVDDVIVKQLRKISTNQHTRWHFTNELVVVKKSSFLARLFTKWVGNENNCKNLR